SLSFLRGFLPTAALQSGTGILPIVFDMKNAESVFPSLPARNERAESWREGKLMKNGLLSPTLSSFFGEEGEKGMAPAIQANYLPNTHAPEKAVRHVANRLVASSPLHKPGSRPLLHPEESSCRVRALRFVQLKLPVGHHDWIGEFNPATQTQRQIRAGKDVDVGDAIGVERRAVFVADEDTKRSAGAEQRGIQLQLRRGIGHVEADRFCCAAGVDASITDGRDIPTPDKIGK